MTTAVRTEWFQEGQVQATWQGLATAESGDGASLSKWPTKTVSITGTFGAAGSVAIHGSNDGVNYFPLSSGLGAQGDLTGITAAAIRNVYENPKFIRPVVTGGDGTTNLTVICLAS